MQRPGIHVKAEGTRGGPRSALCATTHVDSRGSSGNSGLRFATFVDRVVRRVDSCAEVPIYHFDGSAGPHGDLDLSTTALQISVGSHEGPGTAGPQRVPFVPFVFNVGAGSRDDLDLSPIALQISVGSHEGPGTAGPQRVPFVPSVFNVGAGSRDGLDQSTVALQISVGSHEGPRTAGFNVSQLFLLFLT